MRVGINLLYLIPGHVGGVETYATSLISAMARMRPQNEYFLYVNSLGAKLDLNYPNVHFVVCPFSGTRRFVRYFWEQFILPMQVRRKKVDIIHSMGYVGPLFVGSPSVATIHDLNYIALAATMPFVRRKTLAFFVRNTAIKSDHIITDSAFSEDQIVEHIGVSEDKVSVIYLGAKDFPDTQNSRIKSETPYVVAFSSFSKHKNVALLVEAFQKIEKDVPHRLKLIGHLPDDQKDALIRSGSSRIEALGFVDDETLVATLSGADLFVLPSLYEGFGLTLLEAQQLGIPVIASNAASIPEVVGDSATLFDPTSADALAEIMVDCLGNPEKRQSMTDAGYRNLERFSWEETAQQTLDVYEKISLN